jgi:O-methyltransferase
MSRFLMKSYYVLSVPISILFATNSRTIQKTYKISWYGKFRLGFRMFLNTLRIPTGTSYKSHLAMALKILETPPSVPGDVVECGTWKGGSAANLSLVCQIVGRKLKIYDSFEGLPEGEHSDREAKYYKKGDYCGSLEEVKSNIKRYGAIEACEFVKGWFNDTLPQLKSPVLLAFIDVDLEASLHTCVKHIWPNLVEKGYIFIDEVVGLDYCALFYSERYWKTYFDRTPPGLIGAGTGLPLGDYYIGPFAERDDHPMQHANAGAYTRKDMSGHWAYYP